MGHWVTASASLAHVLRIDAPGTTTRSLKTAEIVADGLLEDGDFLPTEAELMTQFAVGRATLRKAMRYWNPMA